MRAMPIDLFRFFSRGFIVAIPISLVVASLLFSSLLSAQTTAEEKQTDEKQTKELTKKYDQEEINLLVNAAAKRLLDIQEEDGAWPYEGVYRVPPPDMRRPTRADYQIPVGYRIGGSSIVCSALISAKLKERSIIEKPVTKCTELILKELENPLMEPSIRNTYDVRVWGHIYALDYFCRLDKSSGFKELKKKTEPWIQKLVDAVVFQEIKSGGWNYANQRSHACFVTAPAIQALLLAKQRGYSVPDKILSRGANILKASRLEQKPGGFTYSGTRDRGDTAPGSIARGPVSESTLMMLGQGDEEKIQFAINAFHEHWNELEKRRKKTGTHKPPHGVAPYYFYYGHRYAAQAIRMLPKEKQDDEFNKFVAVLMKTKDPDDTWNDRVFDRSKAYGTAMSLLALSRENVLLPKKIELKEEEGDEKEKGKSPADDKQ